MDHSPLSQKSEVGASRGASYTPFDSCTTQLKSPAAAEHLRRNSEQIMSTWTKFVRGQASQSRARADTSFLRNSLPELLKNLADALENPQWHYGKTRNDNIAREHGQQRQKAHLYAVDEMIDEYAILRHVVCESMLREKGWPLEIMARIHAFIDAAIGTATREFVGLEAQNNARNLVQRCDDFSLRAATAEKRMGVAQQQCADATSERDAGREDIAALLEESQVRERFVALLSHDLRSPLASIIMSAQRLERKPENVSSTTRIA